MNLDSFQVALRDLDARACTLRNGCLDSCSLSVEGSSEEHLETLKPDKAWSGCT